MDPVLCRVCGQALRNRTSLRQHELRHSKQGLYSCCNKTFFSKGTLKRHQCHQHAETCPYVCDVCGKSFALQTDLRRHKARESDKFKCDICGFKAESEGALVDHLTMHVDDEESKRHQCPICLKRFRFQSNLSRHSKKHSTELYSCFNCDKTFKSEETLRVSSSIGRQMADAGTWISVDLRSWSLYVTLFNRLDRYRHFIYISSHKNVTQVHAN